MMSRTCMYLFHAMLLPNPFSLQCLLFFPQIHFLQCFYQIHFHSSVCSFFDKSTFCFLRSRLRQGQASMIRYHSIQSLDKLPCNKDSWYTRMQCSFLPNPLSVPWWPTTYLNQWWCRFETEKFSFDQLITNSHSQMHEMLKVKGKMKDYPTQLSNTSAIGKWRSHRLSWIRINEMSLIDLMMVVFGALTCPLSKQG